MSLGLEEARRECRISPDEFTETAAELGRTLDFVVGPSQRRERPPGPRHHGLVVAGGRWV
jgi:hypothetical protein